VYRNTLQLIAGVKAVKLLRFSATISRTAFSATVLGHSIAYYMCMWIGHEAATVWRISLFMTVLKYFIAHRRCREAI
jgi:hypothetical protein